MSIEVGLLLGMEIYIFFQFSNVFTKELVVIEGFQQLLSKIYFRFKNWFLQLKIRYTFTC